MSTHIPAIIAGEIAMPGSVSDERVTCNKTRARHARLAGLLVTDYCTQVSFPPAGQTFALVDSILPVVEVAINRELLEGHAAHWSDIFMVHIHWVYPPVNLLVFVQLIGYDVMNDWRVLAFVIEHTFILI